MKNEDVKQRQAPLRARYLEDPSAAMVTDRGHALGSKPTDPFHSVVSPMPASGVEIPVGVHAALGGPHDAPTPGDILCAALAACQDSAVRMVANLLGIELVELEVDVRGDVDVRGTMAVDRQVPVGFQSMHCNVRFRAKDGTDERLIRKLQIAAERSCVVLQTLKNPPNVQTTFSPTQ